MANLADSLISSTSRPLRLRIRPDLSSQQEYYQGRLFWVVRDPAALTYFRFHEEEYAILQMLDGETSLDEMQQKFEKQFLPQKITVEELAQFIGMLHKNALVLSDASGQGDQLLLRRRKKVRKERLATLSNVMSIRFKGFDPDRLLNRMRPLIRVVFSRTAVMLGLALCVAALLLVTVQWEVFRAKLPAFREFFGMGNWFWLSITLAITKVLHEFGHGMTCKRFGGECHEMGVMLLVLTPCLFCNVSDSWMLPNKWHRAAIGAAGMYVELVLASLCTFLWWTTEPGTLHYLCLNVMFVSSVSTILFNANPLLRYDGYYILADIVEIPNLRQKASEILRRSMVAWFTAKSAPPDPFLPKRGKIFFALYTIAAAMYRWVIALSILWFLNRVFEPYGLKVIGQLIALVAFYGLVIAPIWQFGKFFYQPGRAETVKTSRVMITVAVIVAIIVGVLWIPLPYYVKCPLIVRPRDAQAVYADVGGTVQKISVRSGQQVSKNQLLMQLENHDVRIAIAKLEGERKQLCTRIDHLRRDAITNEKAGMEIEKAQELLDTINDHLRRRRRDLKRLTIVAPCDGTVLPPPSTPRRKSDAGLLPTWSGTPLEPQNEGAYLANGVLLCRVGDPKRLQAVLAVDQTQVEFIRKDQTVEFELEQFPGKKFVGQIANVSSTNLKIAPKSLSIKAGGDLVTRTDDTGHERLVDATYQASVPLDDPEGLLKIGIRGHAKIHVGYRTLGSRIWRYVSHTFRFRM